MSVMILICDGILVRVFEKTGFHYLIFHRKPLHWDGHGLGTVVLTLIVFGLGLDQLALIVLALLTSLHNTCMYLLTTRAVKQLTFHIALTHAINCFNCALIKASIRQV